MTTLSNCQANTNTIVEVGQRPTITAVSNTSLPCMNGMMPVTLVPTVFPPGNYQYLWSGPNGYSSTQEMPILDNVNESDNGTYTLTVSQSNCDSPPSTTIIDITDIPPAPILQTNTDPCVGDEVILEIINAVQGNNVSWQWSTPQGNITTTEPRLTIPSFNSNNSGDYQVIQTRNSCESLPSEITSISVQSEQITPIINPESDACEGDDIVLNTTTTEGEQFIWFTPTGTIITDDPFLELNNVSIQDAGAYSLNIVEGNCISDTSESILLEVIPIPEPISFSQGDLSICSTDSNMLEICIEQTIADIDNLQLLDVMSGATIQESNNGCFDISFLLDAGTRTYMLSPIAIKSDCPSLVIDTITIDIFETLSLGAEVTADTLFVCNQDFLTLEADLFPDNVDIVWSSTDPEVNIFGETEQLVSISNLDDGANTILLGSSNGSCNNFSIDTITIIQLSEIEATDDNIDAEFDSNILIEPLTNDIISNPTSLSILEGPDNGEVNIIDGTINFVPPVGFVGEERITYEICYLDCDMICDSATIELSVGQNISCFVGNVITPNNDGYNDFLVVPCLESSNFMQNSITIFNQWGDEIFNAAPYNNDWAGIYNGKRLPASTYFYILDLGNGSRPLQGFIVLEL